MQPSKDHSPTEDERLRVIARLRGDFRLFAAECLQIRDKEARLRRLVFNRAQIFLHEVAEKQKRETGKVRIIGLKGRKQGFSTYVGARFYHRSTLNPGMTTRVMAHNGDSTNTLFKMVQRFHENNPLAPKTGVDNAKELAFSKIDSSYNVATAGSKAVGRGDTIQLLHGSEVAHWADFASHAAGIGEAVPGSEGTEIFYESTAAGEGNGFHQQWLAAEAKESEFWPVFVPWYWQDEYRAPVAEGFELNQEDQEYQRVYKLSNEQMQWRSNKISGYPKTFEWLFDQEYPATSALAFRSSTNNPIISPLLVSAAVKSDYKMFTGPLLIGCDPAGEGQDKTAIVYRRDRIVTQVEYHSALDEMQVVGMLVRIWNDQRPAAIFVDKGGLGGGIVSRLRELHVPVIGVNFGERAEDEEAYGNKRAECWWRMQQWFEDQPCRIPPGDPRFLSELSAPGLGRYRSNGARMVETKDDMRKRGIRSPDGADALALTFAEPVGLPLEQGGALIRSGKRQPASHVGY